MDESLDAFLESRDWSAISAATGWIIERDEQDRARVLMNLTAKDGESYRAIFLCDGYPSFAPSVAFVNEQGSKADGTAWPRGDSAFFEEVKPPPNSFICMPLTREGLALHPNWAATATARAWRAETNTLMDLFNRLQRLLNSEHYQGRGR